MPSASFVGASAAVASRSSTITLTTPTGTRVGDLILFFAWSGETNDSNLTTAAPPAGWSLWSRIDTATRQMAALLRRVATDNEPVSHVFPMTATGSGFAVVGVLATYRGLDASTALVASAVLDITAATASFSCPSLTLTSYSDLYLGFAADHGATTVATPPAGSVERVDTIAPVGAAHVALIELRALKTGATGTQTVALSDAQTGVAVAYALRAAPDPTPARDHIAAAIVRLPHMYRGNGTTETNTEKVLRALLAPAADLEAAMQAVLTQRSIDNAVGVQLDAIGKRVGRAREGVTDDEIYRRFVRAQISANKSDGLIEDILTITRLVVDDDAAALVNYNTGAAAFILRVEGVALSDAVAAVLIELLIQAAADGVRPILGYSTGSPATRARWGSSNWGVGRWSRAVDKEI